MMPSGRKECIQHDTLSGHLCVAICMRVDSQRRCNILVTQLLKFLPRSIHLDYATIAFNEFEAADLDDSKSSSRSAIAASANVGGEGVIGFMDPVHRFNFCRSTALTYERLKEFQASLPFIRSTGDLMKEHMPERYEAQMPCFSLSSPSRHSTCASRSRTANLPSGVSSMT
jgi:hypothetical protein